MDTWARARTLYIGISIGADRETESVRGEGVSTARSVHVFDSIAKSPFVFMFVLFAYKYYCRCLCLERTSQWLVRCRCVAAVCVRVCECAIVCKCWHQAATITHINIRVAYTHKPSVRFDHSVRHTNPPTITYMSIYMCT